MSKYKFYINRRTRFHPSLEVSSNQKEWKNMELTSSPTKKGRYIELKHNPSKNKKTKAYLRKYIRTDPISTRKELLKKYNLSEEDLNEIENFLLEHKKVSAKPTKLGLYLDIQRTLTNILNQM